MGSFLAKAVQALTCIMRYDNKRFSGILMQPSYGALGRATWLFTTVFAL